MGGGGERERERERERKKRERESIIRVVAKLRAAAAMIDRDFYVVRRIRGVCVRT